MSESDRPNPDAMLHQISSDRPRPSMLGRLKVFFGAAPGVGKTFAMLEEARAQAAEGVDVVIGYAEPHIRPETEALLLGLEIIPYRLVEYRGAVLKEFDLDAALARKPKLICVDELAHTNAPGMRHQKRWQDIFDLLDAGIDVYTTLNVQHLDSVNDVVERITGVAVKETLPDDVLDRADEVELVDTTPEELTQRLQEGKIYRADVAERAMRQFFNKGNLTALRELALRRTAERVDVQMREHRQKARIRQTWAASERVLVCVGPSPLSARLVRSARRLASSLRASWTAIYVEAAQSMPQAMRDRVNSHLRLAQQLGGDAVTLSSEDVAGTLVDYARERNFTKIIIGKPDLPRWRERLFGSLVDDVIRRSGDVDVYVIRSQEGSSPVAVSSDTPRRRDYAGYIAAIVTTSVATAIGWLLHRELQLADANVLMVYLLGVLGIAWRYSRAAAVMTSVLSVLSFDFLFVRPYWTFAISDQEYLITFLVMLLTGLMISTLMQRSRAQANLFRRRQNMTQAVLDFTSELAMSPEDIDAVAQTTAQRIASVFHCDACILLLDKDTLRVGGRSGAAFADDPKEQAVARWVLDHSELAGAGTPTLPMSSAVYLPLQGANERTLGVLAVRPIQDNPVRDADQMRRLEAFASQAATALDRASLSVDSRAAWRRVEQEHLRNTLLSAVSHDLRTPLTAITGAASALLEPTLSLSVGGQRELISTILGESHRMERVITNLLEISRIESGGLRLHRVPIRLGEVVQSVVNRLKRRLQDRPIRCDIPNGARDIVADPVAIDQVLTNLLENAADHTPTGTEVSIALTQDQLGVTVSVADRGPGLPVGAEDRVFEKFTRGTSATDRRGLGLGLSISRALIEAHGGKIIAANRPGGGAVFRFTLPSAQISPTHD